jgi:polysaccharide pyruvyl transferase WcaK-like protein
MGELRSTTIGLLGPWGLGNLGCEATQEAIIQNIRSHIPKAQIIVFSVLSKYTKDNYGIPSYRIGRGGWNEQDQYLEFPFPGIAEWLRTHPSSIFNKLERWIRRILLEFILIYQTYQRLKKIDFLIISGGGQLLDFWGHLTHPYWMFKYAILSKLTGTKLLFVSVGAGPIKAKISKLFIKTALTLASYRSYRDEESKKYIEMVLGFSRDDPVYPDLVYSIKANNFQKTDHSRKVVGIGVFPYFDPRSWPENDPVVYQTYLDKLASIVIWLVNQGYAINLLIGETKSDQLVVEDLIGIFEKADALSSAMKFVNAEPIQSMDDLLRHCADTDFVIASRFHNVLISTILNKPVIALSYHPKTDSLMKNSGQEKYCLPIDELNLETFKERFIDLAVNRESIEAQYEKTVRINRIELEEQYERIFTNL